MCHPKGTGVFAAFWSENLRKPPKTGIDFTYFGLESGMVFEGTAGRAGSV